MMPDVRRQLLQRFADTTQECRLLGLPAGYVQYTRQLRRVLETADTWAELPSFSYTATLYPLRISMAIAYYHCGSRCSEYGN